MANSKRKRKKSRSITPVVILLVVLAIIVGAGVFFFGPNARKNRYLYVRTGETYVQLIADLRDSGYVRNMSSFELLAKQWKLAEHVKPGKYRISKGISSFELVRMLKNGSQEPVRLVINKLRTTQDLIDMLSNNLEITPDAAREALKLQSILDEAGLDTNTAICGIIPDTYEFYWNTTAEKVLKKIFKSYGRFWTDVRKSQAKAKGLTPVQVAILASIVEEETNRTDDKPKIASVYLNRLEKGMKLQADPTVRFAIGDFNIHRVTGKMLQFSSPYNTYQNSGLPPGPICTPAPGTVDAVLQAPKTTFVYFCAKADLSGATAFASTDAEHLKNAQQYQKALNARGIH